MVRGVFTIPFGSDATSFDAPCGVANDSKLRNFVADEENALLQIFADTTKLESLSPLVLVGATGTGKTLLAELLAGLASPTQREVPRLVEMTISGADYARAFANALDTDALSDFRDKFQRAACLVLDDLTELAGKQSAQSELARLLDYLHDQGRPVIVTTRTMPNQIARFEANLASRLSSGLVVPIAKPGEMARRQILLQLAQQHRVSISREALDLLARTCAFTVPELNRTVLLLKTKSAKINKSAVLGQLERLSPAHQLTIRTIAARVCRYLKLKLADVRGETRRRAIVQGRGIAMYLIRQRTSKSLEEIGRYFGNRDHTTVLHACRKIETQLKSDVTLQQQIGDLEQLL